MTFRSVAAWLLLASWLSTSLVVASPQQQATSSTAHSSPLAVSLSFESSALAVKESTHAEGTFSIFETEMPLIGEPGAPALPMLSQMIGVPSRETPHLTIHLADGNVLPHLTNPLEPVPTHKPVGDLTLGSELSVEAGNLTIHYLPDEHLYAQDTWYPADPVTLSKVMTLRGQLVTNINFFPVQVNLATGELRTFSAADIVLDWSDTKMSESLGQADDPHFESVLAASLSNYEQARAWRLQPQATTPRAPTGSDSWIIQLTGTGVFRIPFTQLASAGVPLDDLDRLAVYYGPVEDEQEQAILIDDDALYLINQHTHGRWSKQVGYRLTVLDSEMGRRMSELPSPPTQPTTVDAVPYEIMFEEDHVYETQDLTNAPEVPWYWKRLTVFSALPTNDLTVSFDLPYLVEEHSDPAIVTTQFIPINPNCHYAQVEINNTQYAEQGGECPGTDAWNTTTPFTPVMEVPHSNLNPTGNTFKAEQQYVGETDLMLIDRFMVQYQRRLVQGGESLFFDDQAREGGTNFNVQGMAYVYLPLLSRGSGQRTLSQSQAEMVTQKPKLTLPPKAPSGGNDSPFLAFEVSMLDTPQLITQGETDGATFSFGRPDVTNEKYVVVRRGQTEQIDALVPQQGTSLRNDLSQTDYLLITHPDFVDAVEPLRQLRQNDYTVRLVTTSEIYHQFGTGVVDPQAIRHFLAFAYQNWDSSPPAYALLVGDTTYDPFDIGEHGSQMWVPPIMSYEDPFIGEVPSDHSFVVALGDGDNPSEDPLSDIHLGRLPAKSVAEAASLAQKIVNYENLPAGDWQRDFLLVTDDAPDPAGDFYELSDSSAELFPTYIDVAKVYLRQPGNSYPDEEAVRAGIISEMGAGKVLMQYIGHGSPSQWGDNPGLWRPEDVSLLQSSNGWPINTPWTCWDGYFVAPTTETISEEMLRLPEQGIIAAFAPTGQDVATGHDQLTVAFYEALFALPDSPVSDPVTQLGPLTFYSKNAVAGGTYERLMYTYVLLGDPALNLRIDLE